MKRNVAVFIGVTTLVILVSACATMSKADTDEFEAYVLETWERYSAYMNAGNSEAWIELWHPDGVQLPPGRPAFEGKSAILGSVTAQLGATEFEDFTIMNKEVEVSGNLGFARGNYSFKGTPKAGGDTMEFAGKYLTIFKRQADGSWKIYRDCFNSNG